jgi:hypothetical protein
MMPVPAGAARSVTLPAPWRPAVMMQGAAFRSGTRTIFFLAEAVALRIASGTSRALPWPKPTRPLLVAHDDQRSEAEALAALHRLGNAVDVDQLFDQLLAALPPDLTAHDRHPAATAATVATAAALPPPPRTPTAPALAFAFYSLGRNAGLRLSLSFSSAISELQPASRAASASAFTRPWKRKPPRSNTTW